MTIYEKLKSELAKNSNGGFLNLIPGIAGKTFLLKTFLYRLRSVNSKSSFIFGSDFAFQ